FTVSNNAGYQPLCADTSPNAPACPSAANHAVGFAAGSGDYNADGNNNDYPDANSYHQGTSRQAFLTGIFTPGQFTAPATLGTQGNEKVNQFRGPNFAETDVNFYKDTPITERINFQFRFEFFNLFNRANLANMDTFITDGNFGRATAARIP